MNNQATHNFSKQMQSKTDADAEGKLVAQLRQWGIRYLTGENASLSASELTQDQTNASAFLQQLATCPNARVHDAIISLLLLHPELAAAMLDALQGSADENTERLSTLTLAALYLQRLRWYQLTLAFGHMPAFPEHLFAFLWQSRWRPRK